MKKLILICFLLVGCSEAVNKPKGDGLYHTIFVYPDAKDGVNIGAFKTKEQCGNRAWNHAREKDLIGSGWGYVCGYDKYFNQTYGITMFVEKVR